MKPIADEPLNGPYTYYELGQIEAMEYGVAQLQLVPGEERIKVVLPKNRQFKIGEIYSVSHDHKSLILPD